MELEVLGTSSSTPDRDDLESIVLPGGHGLPGSFKRFAAQFGYGRMCGLLIMYSSEPSHPDSVIHQGARVKGFIDQALHEDYLEFDPDGDEALAARLYPFAGSENGEYFAWDVRAGCGDEYEIYVIASRMAGITHAAHDLGDLLDKMTSMSIKEIMGPGYEPLPPTFEALSTERHALERRA
ncbi:hypothetical protein [Clavibacter tessellarius]|uniref:hypothetical protein n=1 Tax=Clavibacter TaxID=1573 RepID=UPI003255F91E